MILRKNIPNCPCCMQAEECYYCNEGTTPKILKARFSGVVSRGSPCGDALAAFLNGTDITLPQTANNSCVYCATAQVPPCSVSITGCDGLAVVPPAQFTIWAQITTYTMDCSSNPPGVYVRTRQETANGFQNPSWFCNGDKPALPMDCSTLDATKTWSGDQQLMVVDYSAATVRVWAP